MLRMCRGVPTAWVALLVVLGFGCATSGDEAPSNASCTRVREHVVDLRVADLPVEDRATHRAALLEAQDESFRTRCRELSNSQLDCALEARDQASLVSCIK